MSLLRIRSASAIGDTALRLVLTDGSIVERELRSVLRGPIFDSLRRSPAEFAQVRVEGGSASWPNGADLCPDVLIWGGRPPTEDSARPAPFLLVPAQDSRWGEQYVAEEP
jgi:hypothetical protein